MKQFKNVEEIKKGLEANKASGELLQARGFEQYGIGSYGIVKFYNKELKLKAHLDLTRNRRVKFF